MILCQFWLCEEAQCVYLRRHLGSPILTLRCDTSIKTFSHHSKQFLNSTILMPFSSSAVPFFTSSTWGKCFPLRTFSSGQTRTSHLSCRLVPSWDACERQTDVSPSHIDASLSLLLPIPLPQESLGGWGGGGRRVGFLPFLLPSTVYSLPLSEGRWGKQLGVIGRWGWLGNLFSPFSLLASPFLWRRGEGESEWSVVLAGELVLPPPPPSHGVGGAATPLPTLQCLLRSLALVTEPLEGPVK